MKWYEQWTFGKPDDETELEGSAVIKSKCKHRNQPNMAYIDFHQDAVVRRKRGEKQIFCLECGKYVWGEYWPKKYLTLWTSKR